MKGRKWGKGSFHIGLGSTLCLTLFSFHDDDDCNTSFSHRQRQCLRTVFSRCAVQDDSVLKYDDNATKLRSSHRGFSPILLAFHRRAFSLDVQSTHEMEVSQRLQGPRDLENCISAGPAVTD